MNELNGIKARLGSIAPSKMNELPKSVQRLLEDDMPRLIAIAEAADNWDNRIRGFDGLSDIQRQHDLLRTKMQMSLMALKNAPSP